MIRTIALTKSSIPRALFHRGIYTARGPPPRDRQKSMSANLFPNLVGVLGYSLGYKGHHLVQGLSGLSVLRVKEGWCGSMSTRLTSSNDSVLVPRLVEKYFIFFLIVDYVSHFFF